MTFDRLKVILAQEEIDPYRYDVLDLGGVRGHDGYVICGGAQGYELYYIERGIKELLGQYGTEHDVCVALLEAFAHEGKTRLTKYIHRSEYLQLGETIRQLTIEELKDILALEGIPACQHDALVSGHIYRDNGYLITKDGSTYSLCYVKRTRRQFCGQYECEHEVCAAFLYAMALKGATQLARYLYYPVQSRWNTALKKLSFERLRTILAEEKIDMRMYDILDLGEIQAREGCIICKNPYGNGYIVYSVKRGVKDRRVHHTNEHEAVMGCLHCLVGHGEIHLARYIYDSAPRQEDIISNRMTISKLNDILVQENVHPGQYDLDDGYVADGYVIAKGELGYDLFCTERAERYLLGQFADEHDVCSAMLLWFVCDGTIRLGKYIHDAVRFYADMRSEWMKLKDLEDILVRENIDTYESDANDADMKPGDEGYIITEEQEGYVLYRTESMGKKKIAWFRCEQDVCIALLLKLVEEGKMQFAKYILRKEYARSRRLVMEDVREILRDIGFDMDQCSICDDKGLLADEGIVMTHGDKGYLVCHVIDGKICDFEEYDDESAACKAFLRMVRREYRHQYDLSGYIELTEDEEDML